MTNTTKIWLLFCVAEENQLLFEKTCQQSLSLADKEFSLAVESERCTCETLERRQPIKKLLKMKIHLLVALFSLLVFVNCNSISVTSLTKPESASGESPPAPKQQDIVLFHGLGDPASTMDDEIKRFKTIIS